MCHASSELYLKLPLKNGAYGSNMYILDPMESYNTLMRPLVKTSMILYDDDTYDVEATLINTFS